MDNGVMHVKENEDHEECPIIQDNLHSRAAPAEIAEMARTKRANMIATACARYTVLVARERERRERERLTTQDKMPWGQ